MATNPRPVALVVSVVPGTRVVVVDVRPHLLAADGQIATYRATWEAA
jgi:hypothetical protein